MKRIDTNKVVTEYRDQVTQTMPIYNRKYTMTHSDDTATMFVTIGTQVAQDKIESMRDEVMLTILYYNGQLQFFGTVLIDDPPSGGLGAEKRNEIFLREMSTALQAIRYGDRKLFEQYPMLDDIPVYIWFQSQDEKYNKLYDFGKMRDYD